MIEFGKQYASHYDLFYADKDYRAEAVFIQDVIQRYNPRADTLLEFGCGSARHAVEFVQLGLQVTGIDRSAEMIALGEERRNGLPSHFQKKLKLMQGDAINFRSESSFDAVVSLFHVVSYQTTNEALCGTFNSARAALKPGGLFLFDFWYGPAVLTERPQVRVKRITTPSHDLTRIAEPEHQSSHNVVKVKYTFFSRNRETGSFRAVFRGAFDAISVSSGN